MIDRVTLFRFVPLPGSYVYQYAEKFNLHGTHYQPGWDGDWAKYHIYHQDTHWWGTKEDYVEMHRAYIKLKSFVESTWQYYAGYSAV